jgi:hypothetical protein
MEELFAYLGTWNELEKELSPFIDANESYLFIDSIFRACEVLESSRKTLYAQSLTDDVKSYLPCFVPSSTRFVSNSTDDKTDEDEMKPETNAPKSVFTFTKTNAPPYYCDGRIILKVEARLEAALAFITSSRTTSNVSVRKRFSIMEGISFSALESTKLSTSSRPSSLRQSVEIDSTSDVDWKSARMYEAGKVLVRELRESHEVYKKQKIAENFTCHETMGVDNWNAMLNDVIADADWLFSWIIKKLYREPQSTEAQVYMVQQIANTRPLLCQQYHIVSLFIPLVRGDFSSSGVTLSDLNPFLTTFEKNELKETLGTFLILKTYVNKIRTLIDLETYPKEQKDVFDRMRIEELTQSRQVSCLTRLGRYDLPMYELYFLPHIRASGIFSSIPNG